MNRAKKFLLVSLAALMTLTVVGCESLGTTTSPDDEVVRPAGWTEETHSNDAEPNYDVVFPQDKVNQITITIDPADWEAMQANMTEMFGAAGTQQAGGQPGMGMEGMIPPDMGAMAPATGNLTPRQRPGMDGFPPITDNFTLGQPPRFGGLMPGTDNLTPGQQPEAGAIPQDGGINAQNQDVPGWADMTPDNPEWVPATIEFNGLTWTNVGVRYKGNSSLTSGWRSGSLKMPLKLDFDEFEDEYPEINNQRFYGFKQLSLSNAFSDETYMHDVIAADILEDAGLVAAETAYYEVILDYGEGPVSLGLYVMIEVIDDTVIERCFGDDDGNIYEADGRGVSLAEGTYSLIQSSFQKENNEDEADWSDIEELYKVLHDNTRTTDPEAWRESLESVFDVDSFLEWLSIAAIIQHWDTYGSMTHNFYLYDDPATGQLTWISWDHNQVLAGGGGIGVRGARAVAGIRAGSTLSLGRDEVTDQWPLIRYLLDDPVYSQRYLDYLEQTVKGAFNPYEIAEKCETLAELIAPYVDDETAFEAAVQALIDRAYERYETTNEFLTAEGK